MASSEALTVAAIFSQNDTNGNGILDYDEFPSLLRNLGKPDVDGDNYAMITRQLLRDAGKGETDGFNLEEFTSHYIKIDALIEKRKQKQKEKDEAQRDLTKDRLRKRLTEKKGVSGPTLSVKEMSDQSGLTKLLADILVKAHTENVAVSELVDYVGRTLIKKNREDSA